MTGQAAPIEVRPVDLGLPSGVLWSSSYVDARNVGGFARTPYTYDCSYASFGNIVTHEPVNGVFDYDWGTSNDGPYAETEGAAITYPGGITDATDVARVICGEHWQMPTADMANELISNCDFIDAAGNLIPQDREDKTTTVNKARGFRLRSRLNGADIFFACCGKTNGKSVDNLGSEVTVFTRDLQGANSAKGIVTVNGELQVSNTSQYSVYRYRGLPIRPVYIPPNLSA